MGISIQRHANLHNQCDVGLKTFQEYFSINAWIYFAFLVENIPEFVKIMVFFFNIWYEILCWYPVDQRRWVLVGCSCSLYVDGTLLGFIFFVFKENCMLC